MQKNLPEIKDHSINEMNSLILSIQEENNNISEKDLAVKLGYKSGYFSQCRSRNFAPDKLLKALKANAKLLQKANTSAQTVLNNENDSWDSVLSDEHPTVKSLAKSLEFANKARLVEAENRKIELVNNQKLIDVLVQNIYSTNLNKPQLNSPELQEEEEGAPPASSDELKASGRSGPFQSKGRNAQADNSKGKSNSNISSGA